MRATKHGRRIAATAAAKNFGTLVDRVREERAVYVIERSGVPVAEIRPVGAGRVTVADLVSILRASRRLDEAYLVEVEAGAAAFNQPAVPQDRWES